MNTTHQWERTLPINHWHQIPMPGLLTPLAAPQPTTDCPCPLLAMERWRRWFTRHSHGNSTTINLSSLPTAQK